MKTIRDPNKVPAGGGFRYKQPESGMTFQSHSLRNLKREIKAHRIANNYPVGMDFDAQIEKAICEEQSEICVDNTPPTPPTLLEMARSFAKAMLDWKRGGFKVVSFRQFIERRETCRSCPFWGGDGAMLGLGRCGKCGCSGLKLFPTTSTCPVGKWKSL